MDRNQFVGLILMFALLAVYFTWFAPDPPPPTPEEVVENTPIEETNEQSESTKEASVYQTPDSLIAAENFLKYGAFANAAGGEEQLKVIENDELLITFSNIGGQIKEVVLKNHLDYLGRPFKILDGSKSNFDLIVDHQGKKIDLTELAYTPSIEKRGDTTHISYTINDAGYSIEHVYTVPKDGFQIGYALNNGGLNSLLNPIDVVYLWNHAVNVAENTLENSRYNSNVRYYLADGDYDELSERSFDFEEETLETPVHWVAFKQKFFTSAIIAKSSFSKGYVNQRVDMADTTTVKLMAMNLEIPYADFINGFEARYYFGENRYSRLKKVAPEFEENLDMGWGPLPVVNKFLIIPIFQFLQGFLSNYGLIITLIVLIIKLILTPLTYKSYMSMAKMRVMKPELDEIKEKYEGDMQKQQQEQMKLYQQVGINPLSGCIPMLLQMPILFSLFFFFPNAVDLRGKSFLWADDLSTYDSILNLPFEIPFYGDHISLFTLLMTITTVLTIMTSGQSSSVQGPMKTVQYMMPVMMLFFLNNYASGLTFYYFVSNMTTLGQNLLFRKFIDEDKIHRILQENKKKNANKKKSKFQTRLEEAMKAKQETQRKGKKKK
ncbi:MAG: membrane protein insertase YidC [Ekhidna sp.]